jgi:phospholipid/cholesterol/gamma-HCH transport system substrate-binding protein
MRANLSLELGTGLFVILGFAALWFLTTQLPGSGLRAGADPGYVVTARFDNVGELKRGAPVTMAGVQIGRVESVDVESTDYRALVTMRIEPRYDKIPEDSDASIQTQGLLGAKVVGITPGGSETYLADGGQIEFTQSAVVLESLINRLLASFARRGSGEDTTTESPSEDGSQEATP